MKLVQSKSEILEIWWIYSAVELEVGLTGGKLDVAVSGYEENFVQWLAFVLSRYFFASSLLNLEPWEFGAGVALVVYLELDLSHFAGGGVALRQM